MDNLLKLLRDNAALTPNQLSKMLNLSEGEVVSRIKAYENDRVILAYRTVLNEEKLATIQGVISTATHFMLKPYKEQGVLMTHERNEERLAVAP